MARTICDLSHWNKVKDWKKLRDVFIIHKCTEGTSYLDPTYKERKDKIQASYHFARGGDAKKEADWFCKNSNEKMLVLDWEIEHIDPAMWCTEFIKRVKEKKGIDCWLYTNDARALKHTFPSKWKKWIARYKDYTGTLDWKYEPKSEWDMWQYTSRGRLDGVEGNVDLNVSKIDLLPKEEPKKEPIVEIPVPKPTKPVENAPEPILEPTEPIIINKNNMEQVKNSFDKATLTKIGKGALIAGGGALAVYLLQALSLMSFGESTPLVVALCSILINAIKEYQAGK